MDDDALRFTFASWDAALDMALFCCAELKIKMRVRRLGPGDWETAVAS